MPAPRLALTIFLACFIFPSAHARPLELSCSEASQVARLASQAIAPEHLGNASAAISRTSDGQCTLSLSGLLSDHLKAIADRPSYVDGPNCWGTTLFLKGLRQHYTYVHDPEFSASLDSSGRCRQLSPQEEPRPGDIGTVRALNQQGRVEERHGFLFLNERTVISRLSFSHEAEAEIAHPETFWNRPGLGGRSRDRECRAFGGSLDCDSWTSYYRCESGAIVEPLLQKQPELHSLISSLANELEFSWIEARRTKEVSRQQDYFLELIDKIYGAFSPIPESADRKLSWAYFESLIWQYTAVQTQQQSPLNP